MTKPLLLSKAEWRERERVRLKAYRLTDKYRESRRKYARNNRHLDVWKARERRHAGVRNERYPEKKKAKRIARSALLNGAIARPEKCERCGQIPVPLRDGRPAIHGHHNDYSKPLVIEWLCIPCHSAEHRTAR